MKDSKALLKKFSVIFLMFLMFTISISLKNQPIVSVFYDDLCNYSFYGLILIYNIFITVYILWDKLQLKHKRIFQAILLLIGSGLVAFVNIKCYFDKSIYLSSGYKSLVMFCMFFILIEAVWCIKAKIPQETEESEN